MRRCLLTPRSNNAGNLTSAINTPNNGPAADTQCFSYDYLRRLTQAWTPTTGGCTSPATSSNLGGPAPYWQNYTYSTTGNRLTATYHATTTSGTDKRDTYSYPTPGPASVRPNAANTITHASAPAGSSTYTTTGTDSYTYDADGNTATAPGQTITWGPTGKLATFTKTSSGQTQNRIYDADGTLLIQSDPANGTTAYLGDAELHLAANGTTLTGQRTYTDLGRTVASRAATAGITGSTLTWLDTDPQGTATITENPTTGTTTVRRSDPFGNNRGTAVTWPTDRGFLNAPTDTFTGLTQLGARAYNPVTGTFLTVDPVLDPSDPQQNNGYSYAANNPTSNSDPSGLRFACDSGDCDKNGTDHSQATSGGCGTRACGNDAANSPGTNDSSGGNSATSPKGSSTKPIRVTAHVSVDASAPNAAKLVAAFNAYAASVNYLDGYGPAALASENESFVWASFCDSSDGR